MKNLKNFNSFILLLEERGSDIAVRTVVRDIVNLFKSGMTGTFTLPHDRNTNFMEYLKVIEDDEEDYDEDYEEGDYDEDEDDEDDEDDYTKESFNEIEFDSESDFDEDDFDEDEEMKQTVKYDFPDFPVYFWVTLRLEHDYSLTRFRVDASAGLFDIEIIISYNPEVEMHKYWKELSGELNIDVAHELEHLLQHYYGEFPNAQKYRSNFQYYMLPVEVPAQIAGFKRLYDLEKEHNPDVKFEELVRYWFLNRRYISRIKRKSENTIIANIVTQAKKKYPHIN